MKTQTRRDALFFIAGVLASAVAAVVFYRPFFTFFDRLFGPGIEYTGFVISHALALRLAVFDFAYVFFLAAILSCIYRWQKTLRFWVYGYLLLMGLSLFVAGIYIPSGLRFIFILVSASVGFLIGQGIRLAVFLLTGRQHFAIDLRSSLRVDDSRAPQSLELWFPTKREFGILAISVAVSISLGVALYRQFFSAFEYFLSAFGGGFYTIDFPPYSAARLIEATLGLSFSLMFGVLLSLFLQWRKAVVLWTIGYIAFVVGSVIFYKPLFIPNVYFDLPLIVIFGLIGFAVGQGIRLAITYVTKSR